MGEADVTDLLDVDTQAASIVVRKPNGAVAFSAADRMPHMLGRLNVSDVQLDFGYIDQWYSYYGSDQWDHYIGAHAVRWYVPLAAYAAPVLPKFWWGKIRLRREKVPMWGDRQINHMVHLDTWMPFFGGSLWLETYSGFVQSWRYIRPEARRINRALDFSVQSGNVVVNLNQAAQGGFYSRYTSAYGAFSADEANHDMRSIWRADIDLAFGVFDI